MEMLKSSILGRDFVNYRKSTIKSDRVEFSSRVRTQGIGNVPIVVDSVDAELSKILSKKDGRYIMYGKELVMHMDSTIAELLKTVKIVILQQDREDIVKTSTLKLGLEDGTIPEETKTMGDLWKKHKNEDDRILYVLVTKENSMYGYIMSIIKYLSDTVWSFVAARK